MNLQAFKKKPVEKPHQRSNSNIGGYDRTCTGRMLGRCPLFLQPVTLSVEPTVIQHDSKIDSTRTVKESRSIERISMIFLNLAVRC